MIRFIATTVLLTACAPPLTELDMERLRGFEMVDPTAAMLDEYTRKELDQATVELGRQLFYDCDLSSPLEVTSELGLAGETGKVSCAICHDPLAGGASDWALPPSARELQLGTNAPTILNAGWRTRFGWTARYDKMHHQIAVPLRGAPHNLESEAIAAHVLGAYGDRYTDTFGADIGSDRQVVANTARALEAFVRTLDTPNSKLDRFLDEEAELTSEELLGAKLFINKAACIDCHDGPILSDSELYALGVDDSPGAGAGEYQTPQLRNVELTGPYMHDGSLGSLWEVLDFYNTGGHDTGAGQTRDRRIEELNLTEDEIDALFAFLTTLTGTVDQDLPEAVCE